MAFLRIENKKSGCYLRIVKTFRDNGKPRQETLYNLGKKEDYTPEQLQAIGLRLYELGGGSLKKLLGDSVRELGRYNYGFYQLYSKILKQYGIDTILNRIESRNKISYNLTNSLLLMLLERLNDPSSKRRNYFNQEEYLGIDAIELHQLYRTLDCLADTQHKIQDSIYMTGRNLFNQSLDLVFYDVTTFYFDSEIESGLRQKGFSKDGKMGKAQIVFGLLIDKDKQPIGYRIYRGDFYEGHTFIDAVDKLKDRYRIDKVIVVADRGMLSKTNLEYITQNQGYEFIVGERIKTLPKDIREYLIDKKNYHRSWIYTKDGEEVPVAYTTVEYQGRKIIGTYSEKRAQKDAHDREERLEKTQYLLSNPSLIKNKARRYYIKSETKDKYTINEEKIVEDSLYDGFIGIATNNRELPESAILDHYKHLYQIEHSFRKFKTHLETRPMFHWTDKRIEGHICLCYIAYTLNNHALLKIQRNGIKMSEEELRRELSRMQVSLVQQKGKQYYLRSRTSETSQELMKIFNLSEIPNLIPKSSIIKYL